MERSLAAEGAAVVDMVDVGIVADIVVAADAAAAAAVVGRKLAASVVAADEHCSAQPSVSGL